jgi:hypothetical protein
MSDEVQYAEVTASEFAGIAAANFVIEEFPAGLLLRGRCPRCDAPMEAAVVDAVVKGGGTPSVIATEDESGGRLEPIVCACLDAHPGRPEGRSGCGAYWLFVIPDVEE